MVEKEAGKKKQRSLRNAKLKANRASVTEKAEDKTRKRLSKKNNKKKLQEEMKRSSVTEGYKKQRHATLKRLNE